MDMSHARTTPAPMPAHGRGGALARTLLVGLIAFLTVIDLFGTQAILPALTRAYGVTPAAMGLAVNASTFGMAVAGLARRLFQPPHRPAPRHPGEPRAARDPDRAPRLGAGPCDLHAAAGRARAVHGLGLHAHPRLSRRALQRHGRGRRLRGLHRRQRREQSLRPALRRRRSPIISGSGRPSMGSPCSTLPAPSWSHLGLTHATAMPRRGRSCPVAVRDLVRHLARPAAAGELRDRLLHPVRLHRHLHLRQFRARARADRPRSDGARLRLLRLPAVDRDDAAGRTRGRSASGRARRCGRVSAPRPPGCRCSSAEPAGGARRPRARRNRHLLRPGDRDRLRQPHGDGRPRSASGLYLASYFLGGLVGSAVLGQIFDRFGWAACVAGIGAALALAALLARRLDSAPLSTRQRSGISPRFPASA